MLNISNLNSMIDEEIWKNYKGLIEVSNLGNVRSISRIQVQNNRYGSKMIITHKGKNLKPYLHKGTGYYRISFNNGEEIEYQSVHRLVALLFCEIPNELKEIPLNKLHVDHIDGNKTNNVCTNLRWVTPKQNTHNPITFAKWKEIVNSKEHKEKLKKALLDRNWHPSEETKAKMRNAALGRKLSEEQIARMSERMKEFLKNPKNHPMYGKKGKDNPLFGKPLSEEHKKKISEANKGKKRSEDAKMKLRGRKFSEESRIKMAEAKKGKLGNRSIKIVQLTLDGTFVSEHPNGCVKGFCQSAISKCCRGGQEKHKGFKWMYKSDYEKMLEGIATS